MAKHMTSKSVRNSPAPHIRRYVSLEQRTTQVLEITVIMRPGFSSAQARSPSIVPSCTFPVREKKHKLEALQEVLRCW